MAEGRALDGGGGLEHELTGGRAGARREAVGQRRGRSVAGEGRVQQGLQLRAVDAGQGLVEVDDPVVDERRCDAEGGGGAALAEPGLQDPQPAALDGELDVAEVAVVRLEGAQVLAQLPVQLGVATLQLGEVERAAHPADDVLALGVGQVVAEGAGGSGHGVAGEAHPAAGVLAPVAEDHLHDVDGGAEVVGDALVAAVEPGPVAVPGAEDREHGRVQLLTGILGDVAAGLLADDRAEVRS